MTSVLGTLDVSNKLDELHRIYAFLDNVAAGHALDDATRRHLALIAEELFSNTVSYGYPDGEPDTIRITVLRAPNLITLILEDCGAPFDAGAQPHVDLTATNAEDMTVGGLGLFLVHQVSEKVIHERKDGRNTTHVHLRLDGSPEN